MKISVGKYQATLLYKMYMISFDLIQKFESALPIIRQWIDDLLNSYSSQSTSIFDLAFPTLPQLFPMDLLQKAKVVFVKGKIPYPPLSSIGFPDFAPLENMAFSGVTYKNTYFLNQAYRQESLHFHELIHIIQWDSLGVDNFLRAYGVGLLEYGYQNSPLEQMAYLFQRKFEKDSLRNMKIVELVKAQTQEIWNIVSPLLPKTKQT
jgi:hypothetical protein